MEDVEPESPADVLAKSTALQVKWAPLVMLGPLLPSLLAVITVVAGPAIVKADAIDRTADIACGYPIDRFVVATTVNSYLLLVVFSWSFLGFETHITIRGRTRRLLRPFSSLDFLASLYLLLFAMSLSVFIFGTWAVAKDAAGRTCRATNPHLYSFSVFLLATYWIGVFFGLVALGRTLFGKTIQRGAQSSMKKAQHYAEDRSRAQVLKAEEMVVGKRFDDVDEGGTGSIEREQAERLLSEIGVSLNGKNLKKAMTALDPTGEGIIRREDFLAWYRENAQE